MIETHDLTRRYGDFTAVDGLTLHVQPGELFGFLGPNGAGKTTTIRMLVGLLRPSAGTARVAGHDIVRQPLAAKRGLGYLAQTSLLYDRLSGREFLRFLGGLYSMSDDRSEQRSTMLLELLDLSEKADDLVESYSGGMRRKLGLCGALLHDPPLLILDEPLTGLDPQGARRVKDLLRKHCQNGGTVFLSTHVMEIAERVCDRVGILHKGRLVVSGSLAELRRQAQTSAQTTLEDLFLQLTGGASVAQMVEALE